MIMAANICAKTAEACRSANETAEDISTAARVSARSVKDHSYASITKGACVQRYAIKGAGKIAKRPSALVQ